MHLASFQIVLESQSWETDLPCWWWISWRQKRWTSLQIQIQKCFDRKVGKECQACWGVADEWIEPLEIQGWVVESFSINSNKHSKAYLVALPRRQIPVYWWDQAQGGQGRIDNFMFHDACPENRGFEEESEWKTGSFQEHLLKKVHHWFSNEKRS